MLEFFDDGVATASGQLWNAFHNRPLAIATPRRLRLRVSVFSESLYSYFEGELPEAYRVFNPRLVDRVEKLNKKGRFDERGNKVR
jgi:hypothetical protein